MLSVWHEAAAEQNKPALQEASVHQVLLAAAGAAQTEAHSLRAMRGTPELGEMPRCML